MVEKNGTYQTNGNMYERGSLSQWDRRLTIIDKYDEEKIYFDNYYGRFFTEILNQMAMVYGGISFS